MMNRCMSSSATIVQDHLKCGCWGSKTNLSQDSFACCTRHVARMVRTEIQQAGNAAGEAGRKEAAARAQCMAVNGCVPLLRPFRLRSVHLALHIIHDLLQGKRQSTGPMQRSKTHKSRCHGCTLWQTPKARLPHLSLSGAYLVPLQPCQGQPAAVLQEENNVPCSEQAQGMRHGWRCMREGCRRARDAALPVRGGRLACAAHASHASQVEPHSTV